MRTFRVTSASLFCAALLALAGCGGEGEGTTAASEPAGTAPSATASAAPTAAATTASMSDKQLCESAKKAGDELKAQFIAVVGAGKEPSAAEIKKILTDMQEQMTTLASSGGDSKVATALKQFGAEAGKAAAAADPMTASDNPAFEKAGTDITAACKTAGVTVNF